MHADNTTLYYNPKDIGSLKINDTINTLKNNVWHKLNKLAVNKLFC